MMKNRVGTTALIALIIIGGIFLLVRVRSVVPGVPQQDGTPAPALGQTLPLKGTTGTTGANLITEQSNRTELRASSPSPTAGDVISGDSPLPESATQPYDFTQLAPIATPNPTEGLIAPQLTPTGRQAPDVSTETLLFQQVWVINNPETGSFSGRVNTSNIGEAYLNNLVISWKILDGAGGVLDQGEMTWPNLAPNETATIPFAGTENYADNWDRVEFEFTP